MPPFLLGESYGATRMGIPRLFGLCAALLFISSVANASTINVGPSNYSNFGPSATHTGGGVQSTFGQNVRLPPTVSGPTRILPVSRNAVIPYGSIANGAKNFVRISPQSAAASAAITALFLGLDWVFDDDLDSWMKDGVETAPLDPGSDYWVGLYGTGEYPTPLEACTASHAAAVDVRVLSGGTRATCLTDFGSSLGTVTRTGESCPDTFSFNALTGTCEKYTVIDLDPSDWSELEGYLPSADPSTVANAAGDTMRRIGNPLPGYQDMTMTGPSSVSGPETTSTSTDPVTGDTVVTTTNTTTNISYGDTTITTTNTTTSTTYENGQQTGETVTTETPGELPVESGGGGGGASGDWPGFCSWATVVCDWLNWTQEDPPPEQDLPAVIDDDFYQEKTISFGSKSCPPDHQIDLTPFLSTSVAVSFQPLCDFAGLIYYMVMAASYIIAAYITIGVARNG